MLHAERFSHVSNRLGGARLGSHTPRSLALNLSGPSKAGVVTYTFVRLSLSQKHLFAFRQHIWSKTNTVALSSFQSSLKVSSWHCYCALRSISTSRKLYEVPMESHCRPTRIDSACLINDSVSFRPGLKHLIRCCSSSFRVTAQQGSFLWPRCFSGFHRCG